MKVFIAFCMMLWCGTAIASTIVVEDRRGPQTFDRTPERIVVLDWALAQQVLDLGIVPVAAPEIGLYRDWVEEPAMPDGVVDIGRRDAPNLELLSTLNPDVIVASDLSEADVARLEQIAPTLVFAAFDGDHDNVAMARRIYLTLARLFDRDAFAQAQLDKMETEIDRLSLDLRQARYRMPPGPDRPSLVMWIGLAMTAVAVGLAALMLTQGDTGWGAAWPTALTFELRWPRVLAAAAAGLSMALSGVILQRLIRNPLASPDILGVSAGATFGLVATAVFGGASIHEIGPGAAILGSLVVLALLLWLGQRHQHAPTTVALTGIALAALLDALVKVALAAGSDDSYAIIGWLGGSTYRVTPTEAVLLTLVAGLGLAVVVGLRRWLTLLSTGDDIALARGLSLRLARPACLTLAATLAALVTAWLGPVAFVGLLAPHAAVMLGARRAADQTLVAGLIGALLMIGSDWLGRTILFPTQLPAGTVASILGGSYFMFLLLRRRVL